jgi:hypothetical protein
MRKFIIYFFVLCSFSIVANGQFFDLSDDEGASSEPLLSKHGNNILPEKGDVGLGINAIPFLDFAGNLVKINSGTTFSSMLHMQPPEGGSIIYLKYFTGDKTALRAKFRISYIASTEKYAVQNDLDATETLYDTRIGSNVNFDVGLGIEKRRGKTRLQGLYGLEAMLSVTKGSETSPNYKYIYVNEFSATNTTPTTGLFGASGTRLLYTKNAPSYGIGGRGFIGAEYFFAPKMAIGGELAIRLMIARRGSSKMKTESWVAGAVEKTVTKDKTPSGSDLYLDNEYDSHLYLILFF